MSLVEELPRARTAAELQPLLDSIPYARFLGLTVQQDGSDLICKLGFSEEIIGNRAVRFVHGGVLGAFLELSAMCQLLTRAQTVRVPKIINITVEYLRPAIAADLFARATVTRHGRRVANVSVVAYQHDVSKPVATASTHFLLAV